MMESYITSTKPIIGLSPMAGYTDSPYRQIVKDINPDIFFITELISVDAMHYKNKNVSPLITFTEKEHPIVLQLFGKILEYFAEAVKVAEERGYDGIDINMGCPAKKVVRSEYGSALIKNPKKAFEIVATCKKHTTLPVSVKTRIGWADDTELMEFCKGLHEAGADLITIHGRTAKQVHSGDAVWDAIYAVQEALPIPILGNGGVADLADGLKKMHNLSGFLIGRAAIGNPWCFSNSKPTADEYVNVIKKHLHLMIEHYGEKFGVLEFRKHITSYIKGYPEAKKLRVQLLNAISEQEIIALLEEKDSEN